MTEINSRLSGRNGRAWIRLAVAAFCGLLALFSGVLAMRELAAIKVSRYEESRLILGFAQPGYELPSALGILTSNQTMNNCANAQFSFVAGLMAGPTVDRAASACAAAAEDLLARAPAHGMAYVNRAISAARSGDYALMNEQLRLSQLSSPVEGGVATFRLLVAMPRFADLEPATKESLAQDVVMMSFDRQLISRLAQNYVATPLARGWLEDIIDRQSEQVQADFLTAVRRVSG